MDITGLRPNPHEGRVEIGLKTYTGISPQVYEKVPNNYSAKVE